jgi:GTP cyclohydrolase II
LSHSSTDRQPSDLATAVLSSTTDGATAAVRTKVRVPLTLGDGFRTEADVFTFTGLSDGLEHLALGMGDYASNPVPLVRPHSECLTGDVLGSERCDCGPQLREALERTSVAGGYVLYLRQEGRGIGLYNKLDAYALQDAGLDTYEANRAAGFDDDQRDYTAAAEMLTALGATNVDLLTNNPDKAARLTELGIAVREILPTGVFATPNNLRYLSAKVKHTGHTLVLPDAA